ncbi:hypothetical protein [Actinoplanes sp. NPDC049599]|uniref:hypothetical protein n=1 Tax=Actinoplanes sp. NPDC049599 TaxID=3363903 RepID=UPI0037904394
MPESEPATRVDNGSAPTGIDSSGGAADARIGLPELLDALRIIGGADGRDAAEHWMRHHLGDITAPMAQRILAGIDSDSVYLATLPDSPLSDENWPPSDGSRNMSLTRPEVLDEREWEQARQAFLVAFTTAANAELVAVLRRIADTA